jgi:hypothetical protein
MVNIGGFGEKTDFINGLELSRLPARLRLKKCNLKISKYDERK